jgi:hypothetical protein
MRYIGLDCHKQYDHATMIDTETGEIKVKNWLISKKTSTISLVIGLAPGWS